MEFLVDSRPGVVEGTNLTNIRLVHCRKLLRRVVGPPADIDWNQPWHTILHPWHRRIDQQLEYHFFFCRVSVLDCCTGQSPGNEMTVLLLCVEWSGPVVFLTPDLVFLTPPCLSDP